MRLLDLFSGIGGFSLAGQRVWGDDLEIVAFVECDKFCQRVLRKNFRNPDGSEIPIIGDVRDVTKEVLDNTKCTRYLGQSSEIKTEQDSHGEKNGLSLSSSPNGIDLLTGGFPCQPFSVAGKQKGKEDNRFLWPEMFAVIKEIRPRWIVAENVAGIVRMELDNCLSDLESEGYSTQAVIIPACAINAPHRRDRVWIVAYDSKFIGRTGQKPTGQRIKAPNSSQNVAHSNGTRSQRRNTEELRKCADQQLIGESDTLLEYPERRRLEERFTKEAIQFNAECGGLQGRENIGKRGNPQPRLGRIIDGLPLGLDGHLWGEGWEDGIPRVATGVPNRVNRLKALGNAIVWLVVVPVFRAIKEIDGKGININNSNRSA